jgi:nitrite reductase/ring-hydroxylating ferredoxin subunit
MPENAGESSERPLARRSFARWIVFGTIATVTGGLFALREYFHSRPVQGLLISGSGDIPVGGSLIFQYPTPSDPCVLIRTGADAYVAYSRICTHAACPVFYQPKENVLACPCHGGVYSVADGSVMQGPPPRPLPRIKLEQRGAALMAVEVIQT